MPTTDIEDHNDIQLADGVTAYHGSPHEFEEFDISKIGTGEGAQAYGHGLYFAENPAVAQGYRSRLAGRPEIKSLTIANKKVGEHNGFDYSPRTNDNYENIRSSLFEDLLLDEDALIADPKNVQELAINKLKSQIKNYKDEWPEAVPHANRLLKDISKPKSVNLNLGETPGQMYEVNLNAGPEHLLDWDKPLSEQHPKIQEAVSARIEHLRNKYPEWVPNDPEGEWIYRSYRPQGEEEIPPGIDHDAHASSSLKDLGIRGIRYADQGSRGINEKSGSSNYVIFDPKHIKVKRRYAAGGGIKAFAFGNSIPHLDQVSDMIDTHDDIQLAPGVEAIDEMENEVSSNQPSPYAKENDLLQPIGQSKMVGDEDMLFDDGLYKAGVSSHAWNNKKSIRYLHHDEDGNPIGALQIMTHGPRTKKATIQNVYVAEDHRRKNIAANLLKRARRDFDVKHSQDLTDQGRAFAKATKAYGGSIPGPKLTEENADDFARRLIAWTFATAPLFQRAAGGAVDDPNGNWEDAFHATHADVQQFDLSKAGSGTTVGGSKAERAIFLTNDPENAKTYLGGQYVSRSKNPHTEEMPYGVGRHYTEGANIMPLKINTKDFDEWDYGGNLYDANHMKEMIKEAKKSKSPGIKIENIKDQGYMGLGSGKKTTTYVVLDPSRIRSKFAKFDPKQSKKRDLMAADGGSVIDAALDVVSKLRR